MNYSQYSNDKALASNSVFNYLKNTPLFDNIANNDIIDFAKAATVKHCEKGDIIFLHHDEALYFYIIKSGWAKLFRQTLDGSEAIVDILNDDHIFGITALYQDNRYDFGAQIICNSEIIKIPLDLLRQKAHINQNLSLNALKFTSAIIKRKNTELEHRDLQTAPQRIGCFLLKLCASDETGPITLHLPYSKTLVASRLGMKAETFSRALNKLKDSLDITISGSSITINDVSILEENVCQSCSLCRL
ncbi:MAG: Crp/Fnr family transcriptional regulator [Alphaproteobacteria bacterium]|nr:Crp/Fnr family transcriptional regulator [Alphaproteobacteria bacterium]